jgi:uncharacterized protein with HEPN domain
MSEREGRLSIQDIAECIQRILDYTQSGREEFVTSLLIQDAVMRNFTIIGEATKRLSRDLRETYPGIPWKQMAGLRDILTHDYLKIDVNEGWKTVERDLPDLKVKIEALLRELEGRQ